MKAEPDVGRVIDWQNTGNAKADVIAAPPDRCAPEVLVRISKRVEAEC